MTTKAQQVDQQEAIDHLREMVKPGDTIWTVIRHVSASGMTRRISPILMNERCEPHDISYWAARALDWKIDRAKEGVIVHGCGMDMGFHLVYELSSALYSRDGYACLKGTGQWCPSSWHQGADYNRLCDDLHHDGYALVQRWI